MTNVGTGVALLLVSLHAQVVVFVRESTAGLRASNFHTPSNIHHITFSRIFAFARDAYILPFDWCPVINHLLISHIRSNSYDETEATLYITIEAISPLGLWIYYRVIISEQAWIRMIVLVDPIKLCDIRIHFFTSFKFGTGVPL